MTNYYAGFIAVFVCYLLVLVFSGFTSAFLLSSPRDVDRYSSLTPEDTEGIFVVSSV